MESVVINILIVTGSSDLRLMLWRLLSQGFPHNYRITEADQLDQLFGPCQAQPPDCVLLDQHLPDRDALALIADLRRLSDVPVIVLADPGSENLVVQMLQQGAEDYVIKGAITSLRLDLTIRRTVEMARLLRERNAPVPVEQVAPDSDNTKMAQHWQVTAYAQLDAIFASAPNGIAYLDVDLRYVLVNPTFAALHGQVPAAICDRLLSEATPGLGLQIEPLVHQVLASGAAASEIELRDWSVLPSEGGRDWMLRLYPVIGPTGSVAGVGVVMVDITQRNRTAAALRASEERFRLLAEHADDVIVRFQLTPTFQVEYLSPAIERLTGVPREVFYADPQCCFALIYPDDLNIIESYPADMVFTEPIIFRWRQPDGGIGWAELRSWVVSAAESSSLVVEGIVRDITARQQAEDALRASEVRYRTLFETMTQGVAYHDAAGYVLAANPAAQRILGLGPDRLYGYSVFEEGWSPIDEDGNPFPKEDFPALVALRTGQVVHDVVLGLNYPGITDVRWLRIQAVPLILPGATAPAQVYTLFDDISVQRQNQRALEVERQQLAAIVATMHEGLVAFTPDGTIVVRNEAVLRLGHLDQSCVDETLSAVAQSVGMRPIDAQGKILPASEYPFARILRGERFSELEFRMWHPERGGDRWLSISGTPVYDATGKLVLGVVTAHDITQHKDDEATLHAALAQTATHAARIDSLLANAPVGIALLDAELRYQHVNPALAAMNGLPPDAHLGRSVGEVLPDMALLVEPIYAQVLATGEPLVNVEFVSESSAQPGLLHTWTGTFFPVHTADHALLGLGAIIIDITIQRQIEHALQAHHQQLETILETLDTGVVAIQPNGVIALANAATQRHFGVEVPADHSTQRGITCLPPATLYGSDGAVLPEHDWPIVRVLRGERFRNQEIELRLPGHTEGRWLTLSGAPVYNLDGTLILGVLTADDITQHKRDAVALAAHAEVLSRTNAELTRALRLKDEFLAMMSHELRTPLNVILGFAEGMEEGLFGPLSERQCEALDKVLQSGHHLLAILSDILDLAHIEAGAAPLDLESVDVEILCCSCMQFVHATAQQKSIRLLRTIEEGVAGLRADERRLTQILVNLLDNAVKFTPMGGRVGLEVTADALQEQIQFVVWDTGIGIAEADFDRLFQPFTQVDGRLSRQYGGIGLGLSLVRRLVDLHGGSVSLESTPGQGSRFTVSLPWVAADNVVPMGDNVPKAQPPRWVQPPRVVIADDHELTLTIYRDLLSSQGCQVTLARTGREALTQVRRLHPDVVVLDIQMPELDGLTAIRQLRADPAFAQLPIIALTALAMPGDRERALAAGATRYLAKPVSLRSLVATMDEVLSQHKDSASVQG